MNLRTRVLEPELMDDPALDARRHAAALRGLARINWVSASARLLFSPLERLARERGLKRVRVLDVATGAADVPIRLWRLARRAGLPLALSACDISPVALEHARRRAAAAGVEAKFFEHDITRAESARSLAPRYDVVMCSLFLHHLPDDVASRALGAMAGAAEHAVLVNDLRRCRAGLLAAQIGTRLLSRSPVVHVDGPRSVRAAFTESELAARARAAGLAGASVRRCWPWRLLLEWRRT